MRACFFICYSALNLVKDTIDVKTGRGVVERTLHSLDDVQAIEKALRFVTTLMDELKVCIICVRSLKKIMLTER